MLEIIPENHFRPIMRLTNIWEAGLSWYYSKENSLHWGIWFAKRKQASETHHRNFAPMSLRWF